FSRSSCETRSSFMKPPEAASAQRIRLGIAHERVCRQVIGCDSQNCTTLLGQRPYLLDSVTPMPSHLPSQFAGPVKPSARGELTKGRIKQLVLGQGSGIISAPDGDVFFHKTDVQGTFWDLKRGDQVVFELLKDTISGPRAQKVRVAGA